jgi:hypothetical protein
MKIYQIDPARDMRWAKFVGTHPKASVFHTFGWLKALQLTYGYQPVVFTTSSPADELSNGLAFCRVNSWLTGNRLVSLPFSDHCEPLFDVVENANFLIGALHDSMEAMGCKYVEIRSVEVDFRLLEEGRRLTPVATHFFHSLDLRPDLDELFLTLDRDSVQRRIQRAQRASLIEKCGNSNDLLRDFYRLFALTRRRHQLPPAPYAWFLNLRDSQGEGLEIRLAYKDGAPIAAVLTLRFREVAYYKYGCSDARFNKFGAMPWLLWHAVSAAKLNGARHFDLGRTEADNAGLLTFKNHWVRSPKQLVHWGFYEGPSSLHSADNWRLKMAKRVFSHLPIPLLTATGKLLYRHFG